MLGLSGAPGRNLRRIRAIRALFRRHRADGSPDGRARRLLEAWLTPAQREQLKWRRYFDVVGSHSGRRYRIYTGVAMNVCELDEHGRIGRGLCFLPLGSLPACDVMLAQKLALETSEESVMLIAREFIPRTLHWN